MKTKYFFFFNFQTNWINFSYSTIIYTKTNSHKIEVSCSSENESWRSYKIKFKLPVIHYLIQIILKYHQTTVIFNFNLYSAIIIHMSLQYGQWGVIRVRRMSYGSFVVRNCLGVWKISFLAPLNALKIDTLLYTFI